MEIKATSTLMPGHSDNLRKWRKLAGEFAQEGLIIADNPEVDELRGNRVISWDINLYL